MRAYESRIQELEKELAARTEENHELLKLKIEMLRHQLETERVRNKDGIQLRQRRDRPALTQTSSPASVTPVRNTATPRHSAPCGSTGRLCGGRRWSSNRPLQWRDRNRRWRHPAVPASSAPASTSASACFGCNCNATSKHSSAFCGSLALNSDWPSVIRLATHSSQSSASGGAPFSLAEEGAAGSASGARPSARPEMVLFLAVTAKNQSVAQKIKNFFTKWRDVQKRIPLPEMTELLITPQLPEYPKIARDVFMLLLDGKLRSRTETLKFLKPFAPPPPPPPPPPRRGRGPKAAAVATAPVVEAPGKPGKGKGKKAAAAVPAPPPLAPVAASSKNTKPAAVAKPDSKSKPAKLAKKSAKPAPKPVAARHSAKKPVKKTPSKKPIKVRKR